MTARRSRRPRRPARPAAPPPPLRGGWVREEGGWVVRSISGTAATKAYRCPGCHQEIAPGTPHVVAWPAGDIEHGTPTGERSSPPGADAADGGVERRHWHTGCWRRRR